MPLIYKTKKFKLYHGKCEIVMKRFSDNRFTAIVTDPPYGLSFMGMKWDYDVPSVKVWKECLRVLKPGGTLLCFAGSRTQHRMAINIEDAGFILKDCIMWLYGSGFPKATNISKKLDKKAGKERPKVPGGVGTEFGILWNGWKSHGLKPAYEPILVAMKPNEGSYGDNALEHGVSGLNIDGCRIETEDKLQKLKGSFSFSGTGGANETGKKIEFVDSGQGRFPANVILNEEAGRMLDKQSGITGNLNFKKTKRKRDKGWCNSSPGEGVQGIDNFGDIGGASRFFYCSKASKKERDAGCEGLDNKKFTAGNYSQSPTCKTCDKTLNGTNDHSNCSGKVYYKKMSSESIGNHHPTVKPLDLIVYLCKLVSTPTGGIILDPFMGSGTTGKAAIRTHQKFIGIEKEKKYYKIAIKRIKNSRPSRKSLI